jgi:fluoroquinolone transport system permease protein
LAVTLLMVLFLTAVCVMAAAYIAALVVFERDQHTLNALFVSPLRLTEYLNSKIITLTTLVTVEGVTLVLVSLGAVGTNWSLLIAGTALLGVIFTLFGTILIVRFATITSFLMPAGLVTLFLELPAIYFAGLSDSPLWLLIPTSAPMMLIWGAWHTVELWQTVYALVYSAVILGIGYRWAMGAFTSHILVRQRS